jgi:hypothetical protein
MKVIFANQGKCCFIVLRPEPDDLSVTFLACSIVDLGYFSVLHETNSLPVWCA